MEEIFYEDVLETFLFCFFVSLGIIQIMVARRGWHGLSVYGGRVRSNLNNALGAALIIFGFAWYFSDPLHRNVRNIEAFMSLVCLVLGIAGAAAATALFASLSEALRRRLSHGREVAGGGLKSLRLPAGTALVSGEWGERGENLVVVAEPGRGSQDLVRGLYAALPRGRGLLSIHPGPVQAGRRPLDTPAPGPAVMEALAWVERERGVSLEGETFLGLGWSGNTLAAIRPDLENTYNPRGLLLVAPVVPDCEQGFVGDALLSNTPLDVATVLLGQKPWREAAFARILRLWLPLLVLCVTAATAVTVAFDVRWKLFSGPVVGLLISLWLAYFLARRRGDVAGESLESWLVSRLCEPAPPAGAGARLAMVLTSGDHAHMETLPPEARSAYGSNRLALWEDVLRGKFILGGGTPARLAALIWEERSGDGTGSEPGPTHRQAEP